MSTSQLRKEAKRARRDKRKSNLAVKAGIVERRGLPNNGIVSPEEELLKLRNQVNELTRSLNLVVSELEEFRKLRVAERACEAYYMAKTNLDLAIEKQLFSREDVARVAEREQLNDLGWTPRPAGSAAEMGDVMNIKFKIFDGETLVQDETAAPVAYNLGSQALNCDDQMVGMIAGETREVTCHFGPLAKRRDIVGKSLSMTVQCISLMVETQKAGGPG